MLARLVVATGVLAGACAAQEASVETVSAALSDALPGTQFYSEPFTPALAEQILAGYGDTARQSPEAFERMRAAFGGRFQGGTLLQATAPDLGVQTFALVSPGGDVVARFFIPVVNMPGPDEEGLAGLTGYAQAIEAITGMPLGPDPGQWIARAWTDGGFARFAGPGDQALYAWGVSPDFVEITYSSLGDGACAFLPAQGWFARQTCP